MLSWESGEKGGQRREMGAAGGGGRKDVLGTFQVPVLSLAASQRDDYVYQKAGTQMLQDIEYAV